ncbi:MAG: chloride channel protein [Rhodospirillales bacterium]|nr:chloride channel protein [Rhodospirillales bacterium]
MMRAKRRRLRWSRALLRLRRLVRNDQLILSVLALVVGAAVGGAVIAFREAIALVQAGFYGSATERLSIHAQDLAWWHVVLAPAAGGLLIGLFVRYVMPDRRSHGVADAIEANALRGGRMSAATGLKAALVNAASIGVGASVGREGPAVHLGAALGGWLAERLHLTRSLSRTLLGCGVAAAVAASFNAPIAGALFASEVVLGHYALSAFAPIVIASVTATAVSRAYFGDFPAFEIADHAITSFWEFPSFVVLGILAGVTAIVFMQGIMLAASAAEKSPLPAWLRPAAAGLMVGGIAVVFPQVLGVGYGATEAALGLAFPLGLILAVGVAKIVATAISLGFGFGGGVFSPSLVVGAMLGGAYGMVIADMFPTVSLAAGAYTVVGMGAMAAAVLGAPISTALVIFEMTGGYGITLAVMVAVVVASVITRRFHGGSYFAWQLERRGLDLKGGFESALLRAITVADVMSRDSERVSIDAHLPDIRARLQESPTGTLFVVRHDNAFYGTIALADLSEAAFDRVADDLINASDVARPHPPALTAADDLHAALALMRSSGEQHVAVVADHEGAAFLGCIHERDVMNAYNKALVQTRREERGD